MADVPDDLDDFPPLGSRCAGADCARVPTHVKPLVFQYPTYRLTHLLYLCGDHVRRTTTIFSREAER